MSWSKGEEAEARVAARLCAAGWTIEAKNFRRPGCEVDIICSRQDRLLCIEVKARPRGVDVSSLISKRKLARIIQGFQLWLQSRASDVDSWELWLCLVERSGSEESYEWLRLESEDLTQND